MNRFLVKALSKAVAIYGMIGYVYGLIIVLEFPQFQFMEVSPYLPIPNDLFAILNFGASFIGFVVWEYVK